MLRFVFAFGWLPLLAASVVAAAGMTGIGALPIPVLTNAGATGVRTALGLAVSLALLAAAYGWALRRPPPLPGLLIACGGSLVFALASPVLFSADVYAYAYYGDLLLHGHNPYEHAVVLGDPLALAAMQAWDGRIPPRCVYGPVAVAIAALADIAGAAGGTAGQILAGRLAGVLGYCAYVACGLRIIRDARARVAFALNPVAIWSAAEGHNDGAMAGLVLAGLGASRLRPLLFAAASAVKAPALLAFAAARRDAAAAGGLALAALAYVPLAAAVAADAHALQAPSPVTAWQSPLGLLADTVGRTGALAAAAAALIAVSIRVRHLEPGERTAALALAAWFALPNAYPWYAVWFVPLAARRLGSPVSTALLVASFTAAARAAIDAIFAAPDTFGAAPAFHGRMIALEFLPPLLCLVIAAVMRRGTRRGGTAAAAAIALALLARPAGAQTPPGSVPAIPLPAPAPSPSPNPVPAGSGSPAAGPPVATPAPFPVSSTTPTPGPAAPPSSGTPSQVLPSPSPAVLSTAIPFPPAAPATTLPAPVPTATASAPAAPMPAVPPAPTPGPTVIATPRPFNYVITPTPVPVTSPDGPHIVEVLVNDRQIRAGGPLIVRVLTSPNVVGVEARALGRFIAIPQNAPGLFSLAYTMPGGIPFWLLNKNYTIVIAAATADGRQTTVSFPMLLTR